MASVQKLKSGKYRARVSYKVGDRYKQKSFTADTKKEVLRAAALFSPPKNGSIGQMIDTYIDAKKAVLSPSTIKAYISMSRTIKSRYAALRARTEVSQFDAQRIASDLSPKTARNVLGFLSSALRFAGVPFPKVTIPRWELRSDFVPREEDMQALIRDVAGTEMEIPIALGMMGLRRSEIVGLSIDDLTGEMLHIHSAVVYDTENRAVEKVTKTARSDRVIAIPADLARKIREQGYITNLTLHAISSRFSRIVKRLGISMRFHDLRHYFVSYCHNVLRLPEAHILRLGGFSTDAVMKIHYRQTMHDEEISRQVANAFSGAFLDTSKI